MVVRFDQELTKILRVKEKASISNLFGLQTSLTLPAVVLPKIGSFYISFQAFSLLISYNEATKDVSMNFTLKKYILSS